jgi:hypothetical protein
MPCQSDYLSANHYEKEISRVACLLDELAGKPIDDAHWNGYHPRVYGKINKIAGDLMVQELCNALQSCDVKSYSLEMQMWWRDHQIADDKRRNSELDKKTAKAEREAALAKLTLRERQILGLESLRQILGLESLSDAN